MARRRQDENVTRRSSGNIVAPILGAAGATVVVGIAVEKLKIKRPVAAFGTAAVSLIAARNARGAARAGFEAAAIASICIGVTELLARLAKPKPQPVAATAQPTAPSRPADAVSAAEFRNALATIEAKHAAEVEQHQATLHALLNQLRQARQGKPDQPRVVDETPHDSAAAADRMAAIYPLLNDDERRRWSTMVATMPKDELTRIERELLRRATAADGVSYLRSTVLSPSRLPS